MGGPLAVHILELFQRFDSSGNRTTELGSIRVAETTVSLDVL